MVAECYAATPPGSTPATPVPARLGSLLIKARILFVWRARRVREQLETD